MIITETKDSLNYSVAYKDFTYDFGLGGIHGASRGVHVSDDEYIIKSLDVRSYYPWIVINNGFYPKHLSSSFCDVYKKIYEERVSSPKGSAKNKALKLALNGGGFGKTLDKFSFLLDAKHGISVTINGQLLLCMLGERMQDAGFKMLMINTDGFECMVPRDKLNEYDKIASDWEKETGFTLEHDVYKKLIIRDVNNYISQYENGSLKHKGCFVYKDLEFHKNPSMKVVAFTLEKYFIEGKSVNHIIKTHDDIYNFCMRFKATKGWTPHLVIETDNYSINDENIEYISSCQKTNRYYISNKGSSFFKIHEDSRRIGIQKTWKVQLFNKIFKKDTIKEYDINYEFYIEECNKIINAIEN